MTQLLGYSRDELLGKEIWQIGFLPDELASHSAFRELQQKGFVRYEDLPVKCKSGDQRELEIVANLYHENGHQVIQCNMRDVTERRRAEDALRGSEERYRTLFDLGPIAVYSCDASGVIQDFNRTAVELWGRTPRPGDTDARFCGSLKLHRPDGTFMPHDVCPMAEVLSGKIAEARDMEVQIERPDGSRVIVIVNIRPLKNERGEIIGAINCFVDITGRKTMEEAKARLAAIVESSDDAIISLDLNGIITSWNHGAERLFGYTAREAISQPVTMLIPPERPNDEPGILERIRRGESVEHYETVRRRKDGALLDISLTVSPLADARGQIVGASKIARDITERAQMEKTMREAKEILASEAVRLDSIVKERTAALTETVAELEGFSYSIAHDMRAPLRGMEGFARLLLEEHAGQLDDQAMDFLHRIASSAHRMDRLIRDVLSYSKIVKSQVLIEPLDTDRLTRDIIETYPDLELHKAEIQIEGTLPRVLGNEAFLTQCISNLLSNALKFVSRGTRPYVKISAEPNDTHVRIFFEDNGIGIAADKQARVFRMFERIHPATEYEGTGMGLTIARKAAERMGGQLGLESEPGRGSRFWIQFERA
jgi:PAS domain S-box-containing protein